MHAGKTQTEEANTIYVAAPSLWPYTSFKHLNTEHAFKNFCLFSYTKYKLTYGV